MQPPGGGTGSVAAAQAAAAAQPAAAHPAAAQPAAAASSAGQHVRLLSWNVNGLRAALKRLNVTISQFLEGLGAGGCCPPGGWACAHVRSRFCQPPLP